MISTAVSTSTLLLSFINYNYTNNLLLLLFLKFQISIATPLIDLSTIYSNNQDDFLNKQRLGKDGLMVYEELKGYEWPPSNENPTLCYNNKAPFETRCHNTACKKINNSKFYLQALNTGYNINQLNFQLHFLQIP